MPGGSAIRIPSEEELCDLAREALEIPEEHIALFVTTVLGIAHMLSDYRDRGISPNDAIKRARRALNTAHKSLQKAHTAASSERWLLSHFLNEGLSEELAELFSIAGIEALTGQHSGFSLDEREIQFAIQRSRDGGTAWFKSEQARRVQYLMAQNPTIPLVNLFEVLGKYLEGQIALIGAISRGQPKNQERQFALSRLSQA